MVHEVNRGSDVEGTAGFKDWAARRLALYEETQQQMRESLDDAIRLATALQHHLEDVTDASLQTYTYRKEALLEEIERLETKHRRLEGELVALERTLVEHRTGVREARAETEALSRRFSQILGQLRTLVDEFASEAQEPAPPTAPPATGPSPLKGRMEQPWIDTPAQTPEPDVRGEESHGRETSPRASQRIKGTMIIAGLPNFATAINLIHALQEYPGVESVTLVEFDDQQLYLDMVYTGDAQLEEILREATGQAIYSEGVKDGLWHFVYQPGLSSRPRPSSARW